MPRAGAPTSSHLLPTNWFNQLFFLARCHPHLLLLCSMEHPTFDLATATMPQLTEEVERLERRRLWVQENPQLGLGADERTIIDVLKVVVAKQGADLLTLSGSGKSLEEQRTQIHADAIAEVASRLKEVSDEVERQAGLTKLARTDLTRERRASDLVARDLREVMDRLGDRDSRIARLEGELEMANGTIENLRGENETLQLLLSKATEPDGEPVLPDPTKDEVPALGGESK